MTKTYSIEVTREEAEAIVVALESWRHSRDVSLRQSDSAVNLIDYIKTEVRL